MPQIVLENVSKYYGEEAALDNVSLTIEDDTTTAIVGPSGSGKSTLLQLINGLVRPDRGRLVVFGSPIDYDNLPGLRHQIGYAVQGTGLFPHMKVWENITLLARICGWTRAAIRERADRLMALVSLPGSLSARYPHELSGGQQQRVGLCRAMMLNPPVFLLDEPFGAVDPITRDDIHREFLRLQKFEPQTIVLVTHDMREAVRLAKRLVILNEGRVVQDDRVDAVLEHPADEFVRELLRSQLDWGQGD